ncbi:tRNA adenosine(34) deaminase TadA [Ectothiorhodospira mobilis]|uniref:tRNA adenosine(34) deaminase TadA n=1 Tax=Ectothiorhodospira mobilis TaxID=195064 RepID=UPI0023793D84|nr:tRNA adenosine(34) deaminase TadA [Ectothiorhodospira mobilis]
MDPGAAHIDPWAAAAAAEDRQWMARALERARQSAAEGEVPVGAVICRDGRILGEGRNRPIALADPTAHAEILALRAAGRAEGNYRLPGSTLYVTLEPCSMCLGAMVHARVERLVFGAPDPKTGAVGGCVDLTHLPIHHHRIAVQGGLMAEECGTLLRDFFRARRARS